MIDGTSTVSSMKYIIGLFILIGLNVYVFVNNFDVVMQAMSLLAVLLFVILSGLLAYESKTKIAILDAQDNVGTDILLEYILGKELLKTYLEVKESYKKTYDERFASEIFGNIINTDIYKMVGAYETLPDLKLYKKSLDSLDIKYNYRDKIEKRLNMLKDDSFRKSFTDSEQNYPYRPLKNYATSERKLLITKGYQETGYNINDKYYALRVSLKNSDLFDKIGYEIVLEGLEDDVREALLA